MVKNNIEIDVKVKCLEEHKTQADIAKIVGTPASYVNKLIRMWVRLPDGRLTRASRKVVM